MSLSTEERVAIRLHVKNDEPGVFQTWLKRCLDDLDAKDKTIKALMAALKRIRSAKEYRTVSPGESDDL